MKRSPQDETYRLREADAFFERNFADADPTVLRPAKRSILEGIAEANLTPERVIEFGCGYGDLLHHFASETGAKRCVGVEPSARAVAFGKDAYGDAIELVQGTLADHSVEVADGFDLAIVEDVLCWVSRETLFQSVANIDAALVAGGFLFLREFLPLRNSRNRNHHVGDEEIWCFKPAAPHSRIFTASGIYEVVWGRVWMDTGDGWVQGTGADPFESRWSDVLLRKSLHEYYD